MGRIPTTYNYYTFIVTFVVSGLFLVTPDMLGQSNRNTSIEVGLRTGGSYYMGDLNPSFSPQGIGASSSGIIAVNLNKRITVKGLLGVFSFSGEAQDIPDYSYDTDYSFKQRMATIQARVELNFFSFTLNKSVPGSSRFSPFLFLGVGSVVGLSNYSSSDLIIPLGAGVKYKLSNRITIGAEWEIHQLSTDQIDGIENPYHIESPQLTINDDWLSFFGIFATIDIFTSSKKCYNK